MNPAALIRSLDSVPWSAAIPLLPLVTAAILLWSIKVAYDTKAMDMVAMMADRFYTLLALRQEVRVGTTDEHYYYERYWRLQLEQYHYYRRGFLNRSIYRYWLGRRRAEWNQNEVLAAIDYRDGWAYAKGILGDAEFERAMERAFAGDIRGALRLPLTTGRGIVVILGILAILASLFADPLGWGASPGFGWKQLAGMLLGIVLVWLGSRGRW
jgi:hypothetical protein